MAEDTGKSQQQRFTDVMSGRARGAWPALLRGLAAAGSLSYRGVIAARNALYNIHVKKQHRLDRPVVSIGNITTGGTGKTVLVAELARWLRDAGRTPAVLTRGYKGDDSPVGSDEAELLRRELPGLAVEADPDRVAAGRRLLAGGDPPDCFLLDDGFQHRRLARDLDVVALDATMSLHQPLMRMLPRGLLREPFASLARADVAVITRADQVPPEAVERLAERARRANDAIPLLRCRHGVTGIGTPDGALPPDALDERRYLAFCGIGNPVAFSMTLSRQPGSCADFAAFDDHHAYSADEIAGLVRRARAADADLLVTTTKDHVKLASIESDLPIWTVEVGIDWIDDPTPLREAVLKLVE